MPSAADTQWFVIDDFTPGIRHIVSPGQPVGSATQNLTYGCHSNESKGLTPGPKPVNVWTMDPNDLPGTSSPNSLVSESFRIGGVFCNDPVFSPGNTETGQDQNNSEVYVGIEWWTSGTYHRAIQRLLRHQLAPSWQNVYDTHISQTYEPLSRPKRCYFATGRSNNANSELLGPIVIAWVYGGMARFFPDDTATSTLGTVALPGESAPLVSPDTLVAHQNRAVIFPLSLSFMGDPNIISVTNENIYWTDVNDWRTLEPNLAGEYFKVIPGAGHNPTGYGVIASNDSGELLLIKARGGALLVTGDLDNMVVQTLPNVRGAGQALDIGCHTPLGYMYPVDASQMWLWSGGDTTTNVAPFLKPDFYRAPGEDLDGNLTGWGYHFTQMSSWGNYVMAPNNYFCDTDTLSPEGMPSWWLLDDQSGYRFCKYTTDWKGRHMYAAQMGFRSDEDPVLVEYDARFRRSGYSWQSHPLPITIDPADHVEITAVALVVVGEGVVDVTVSTEQNPEGQTRTFTYESDDENVLARRYATRQVREFSIAGSHPQIRLRVRSLEADQPAPQVCPPLGIAYHASNPIPTTG